MAEIRRGRRRWLWLVLAIVALAIAVPIGWHFRPFSASERALIGIWRYGSSYYVLGADRRYTTYSHTEGLPLKELGHGRWYVRGDRLGLCMDMDVAGTWKNLRWSLTILLRRDKRTDFGKLQFDGPETARLEWQSAGTARRSTWRKVKQLPADTGDNGPSPRGGTVSERPPAIPLEPILAPRSARTMAVMIRHRIDEK